MYNSTMKEGQSDVLRHVGSSPAFFELANIPEETNLVEMLRDWLQENGYNYTELKIRQILSRRLHQAMRTGTDRDSSSRIYYPSGTDSAMREAGFNIYTDANWLTYLSRISLEEGRSWIISENILTQDWAYLIYAPQGLIEIPNGDFGLHMFVDPSLVERSLLAVLSPIPMSEV